MQFFRGQFQIQVAPSCIFRFCDSLKIPHLEGFYPNFEMDHVPSRRGIFIPHLTLKIIPILHDFFYTLHSFFI